MTFFNVEGNLGYCNNCLKLFTMEDLQEDMSIVESKHYMEINDGIPKGGPMSSCRCCKAPLLTYYLEYNKVDPRFSGTHREYEEHVMHCGTNVNLVTNETRLLERFTIGNAKTDLTFLRRKHQDWLDSKEVDRIYKDVTGIEVFMPVLNIPKSLNPWSSPGLQRFKGVNNETN